MDCRARRRAWSERNTSGSGWESLDWVGCGKRATSRLWHDWKIDSGSRPSMTPSIGVQSSKLLRLAVQHVRGYLHSWNDPTSM